MEKITLKEAFKQASVVDDLKNFVGLDAQNALGLMTPERLAAVAGGLDKRFTNFVAAYVEGVSTDETAKTVAKEVLESLPDKLCSFSIIHKKYTYKHVIGFIYAGKKYGYFEVQELNVKPQYVYLSNGNLSCP